MNGAHHHLLRMGIWKAGYSRAPVGVSFCRGGRPTGGAAGVGPYRSEPLNVVGGGAYRARDIEVSETSGPIEDAYSRT